jgi:hypothetical protein
MTFSSFVALNWYWSVATVAGSVFSSASFTYVPNSDPGYNRWLALGNVATITPSQSNLMGTITQLVIPVYLDSGLQVTSTSNSALNATYALDSVTLSQTETVAQDVSSGLGFPLNISTFSYPDITGTPHTFNQAQFTSLYIAQRNYIASVTYAIQQLVFGNYASLPSNTATIA